MAKFKAKDRPHIDPGNPTWVTVRDWAEDHRATIRRLREDHTADLRKLDQLLGAIGALTDLLNLPEEIREAKKDPVPDENHFGIPAPNGDI